MKKLLFALYIGATASCFAETDPAEILQRLAPCIEFIKTHHFADELFNEKDQTKNLANCEEFKEYLEQIDGNRLTNGSERLALQHALAKIKTKQAKSPVTIASSLQEITGDVAFPTKVAPCLELIQSYRELNLFQDTTAMLENCAEFEKYLRQIDLKQLSNSNERSGLESVLGAIEHAKIPFPIESAILEVIKSNQINGK